MNITIKQFLKQKLQDNGLFENQADEILKFQEKDALTEVYDKRADGYPKEFLAVAWLTTKSKAKKWLAQNCPEHWAISMFE